MSIDLESFLMYTSYYVPPFTNIDKEMDGTISQIILKLKIVLICFAMWNSSD